MIQLACAVEKNKITKSQPITSKRMGRGPLMSFAMLLQRKKQKAKGLAEVKNDKNCIIYRSSLARTTEASPASGIYRSVASVSTSAGIYV